jgi:hypothetical protein
MRQYTVRLRHDAGTVTVEVSGHTNARTAVAAVLAIEHAPAGAVVWVRVRPVCDYCDRPATRYVRDGQETPLCWDHAREHYDGSVNARRETGDLGVSRLVSVADSEWRDTNAATAVAAGR